MTKTCTIKGIEFPSQIAAARHFGVSQAMICHVMKGRRSEKTLGMGSHSGKPVTIAGTTYNSRKEAAKALDVSQVELSGYLRVCRIIAERGR